MLKLTTRSILEITGSDRKKFLQGLITNDVNKATEKNLIYSAMLNAQGRFLYDFFIFEIGEKLILDCFSLRRDEIFQKLNFYKLRAKVEIKKNDEIGIFWNKEIVENCDFKFTDPRNSKIGYRLYKASTQAALQQEDEYNFLRIENKIPESEQDLTYEKSFILEFGFDDLNAIDYQKGCYIGQELTARTHHTGQIRKKIFHIKISDSKAIQKNSEISCEGKSVGLVLSSIFFNSELHALALLKLPEAGDFENLTVENKKIFIID
jgi:folate-binding protein YgfZ